MVESILALAEQSGSVAVVAAIIVVVAFAESLVVVGIILPGAALMFAFGALIASGMIDYPTAALAAFIGAVLGDGLSFWLGWLLRDRMARIWPFRHHPQMLQRSVRFFHDHGGMSVFIGRFIGPVRPIIPAVAGMMAMSPHLFIVANVASALIWAPLYLLPGYLLGQGIGLAMEETMNLVFILAIVGGFLVVGLGWWWQRRSA
jgi:membrane protein DedA with SNARE-associated domain